MLMRLEAASSRRATRLRVVSRRELANRPTPALCGPANKSVKGNAERIGDTHEVIHAWVVRPIFQADYCREANLGLGCQLLP